MTWRVRATTPDAVDTPTAMRAVTRRDDVRALCALAALTLVVEAPLLTGGITLGMDGATQFVPWYTWLGEQLRAGVLPAWNPHVFSGMPFAGTALSGWGYLPAMLLYTLLPAPAATAANLLFTLLLAGAGVYALARALGMPVIGALVAAIAYEFSGYLFLANPCCFAYAQIEAWLPWALLGVELAVRGGSWPARLRGWTLGGLALSQTLAAWFGQGSMYVLLAVGAWLLWRTLLSPPSTGAAWRLRIGRLGLHSVGVVGVGVLLAAAGVLPRLELNAVSNLAGGYPAAVSGRAEAVSGWRAGDFTRLISPGVWYAGVVPLALAAAAPLVARRRFAVPFFTLLAAAAAILALAWQTPLHHLLLALPFVDRLHPHAPERVLLLAYPAIALLAGATVSAWPRRAIPLGPLVAVALVAGDLLLGLRAGVADLREAPRTARLTDVGAPGETAAARAAEWLREAGAGAAASGRYFGFAPAIVDGRARSWAYSVRWSEPQVAALLVNNEAMPAGLADIQGYDPVHIARYDQLMVALNDAGQEYHFADVRPAGLFSPLLDVLNVRWIVVPSQHAGAQPSQPGDPARIGDLVARLPTVYDDGTVRILERPTALPRAWLVHEARRVRGGAALDLLASGAVDPKATALLETDPPPLAAPSGPTPDTTRVTVHEAGRIAVETNSDADGLLVLSEIAYPAWTAVVDGRPARVLVADHALQAVPVPAGSHVVELAFASAALRNGIAVSLTTALLLAIALVLTRRSRNALDHPGAQKQLAAPGSGARAPQEAVDVQASGRPGGPAARCGMEVVIPAGPRPAPSRSRRRSADWRAGGR